MRLPKHFPFHLVWLLGVALLALGCGPTVPPPHLRPRPTSPISPRPAPAGASADPHTQSGQAAAADGRRIFRLAWSKLTKPYNKGVAVAPSGHIGVLASRHLTLHDGRHGRQVAEIGVCFTFSHALGFVDDDTVALVCENGVMLYRLPTLSYQGVRDFGETAIRASFAPGYVLVAFASGPAKAFSTSDWSVTHELPVDQPVTSLALSQDGRLAALGLSEGAVLLYTLDGSRPSLRLNVKRGLAVSALSFSADGSQLFAGAGPVSLLIETDDVERRKRLRSVGGVRRAQWLGADTLVTLGEDGLLLVGTADGRSESITTAAGDSPVGLAVHAAAEVVCAAQREGKVSCWSRGKLPASRQILIGDDPGGTGVNKTVGRVAAVSGGRVRVKAQPGARLPRRGMKVRLLRYTEQQVGALRSARWVHLADATVTQVEKDVVRLRIVGTVRAIAGVKDPLVYDTPVTIAWGFQR